jgi:hypothetical protein
VVLRRVITQPRENIRWSFALVPAVAFALAFWVSAAVQWHGISPW